MTSGVDETIVEGNGESVTDVTHMCLASDADGAVADDTVAHP